MCKPTKANATKILDLLEVAHPDARIYLDFNSPLELLVATTLAAQCTDAKVNEVTPLLWKAFPTPEAIAGADRAKLEQIVRPTGFFRKKANSVQSICRAVVDDFDGEAPDTLEGLTKLPGIGRKTANVVLAQAFGRQTIAVDTHVGRVSQRIGLARKKQPDKIERELCRIIPEDRWSRATLLMGTHGRRICHARKPDCPNCPVKRLCDYPKQQAKA